MGGFPACWEAVHIRDEVLQLHEGGLLPVAFIAVLDLIPKLQIS